MPYPTIFLAGYPRSGTTWFSNLLNSHPRVIYRHEFLGRCWNRMPEELFQKLKYNHGLDDIDHQSVIGIVSQAHYEADRPPFFRKEHLAVRSIRLKHLAWIATRTSRGLLNPLFAFFFRPRIDGQVLLIKETRSATDMQSILLGLRPSKCIFLFRHPCGCIASHLRGITEGRMPTPTIEERQHFVIENIQIMNEIGLSYTDEEVSRLPIEKFLALNWAVRNQKYLHLAGTAASIFVSYERFLRSPAISAHALFSELQLDPTPETGAFLRDSASGSRDKMNADAGSEFYSVYRSANFRPDGWRETLDSTQIENISSVAGPVLEKLISRAWGQ